MNLFGELHKLTCAVFRVKDLSALLNKGGTAA